MFIKLFFIIIKDIKNYLLNMNTGNPNNPQSFPHPSSSTGGGVGGGGGRGGTGGAGGEAAGGNISNDEEEKRRQREIAADLKEVGNAFKLHKSLPESKRSENSHLINIQREYPSFFDEESGNQDDPIEGLKEVYNYLQYERKNK
jgi:hypothetical protein